MNRRSALANVLADHVDAWRGMAVAVVGDVMLDEWRFTEPQRLCREAPVPIVTLRNHQDAAGGAANTAVNLAALGARPVLVAPVGDDPAGDRVRGCLAAAGVGDATVTVPGRGTCAKRRVLAGDQILLCEEDGRQPAGLPPDAADRMVDRLAVAAGTADTLVICDYGLGGLDSRVRGWLATHRDLFDIVALDAHDLRPWTGLRPTVVTPSYTEALPLFDLQPGERDGDRVAVTIDHARDLLAVTGARIAAVTLDAAGAVVATDSGDTYRTRTRAASANHTVGAGDAYLAAMTLALSTAADVPVAAELAQLTAATTVGGAGTCVCERQALLEAVERENRPGGRVVAADALAGIIDRHRRYGARVVFTNGCFDVLHRGHVGYLEQAAQLGDVLVVGVNSDASVRRLKGPERPVNQADDRTAVLAGLSCVDYVAVFDEDSPTALIEAVRPDVYVKGGDYRPDLVPEAALVRRLGGEVRTLDYIPDRSTSAIIERIRSRRVPRPSSTVDAP